MAGSVADFYFDDASWQLRYAVAKTDTLFLAREVLLAPSGLNLRDATDRAMHVALTQAQIGRLPLAETAKPVCRQEAEKRRPLLAWPLWAEPSGVSPLIATVFWAEDTGALAIPHSQGYRDPHLRSVSEILGYRVMALDTCVGVVADFLLDDLSLRLTQLVVRARPWFFGKQRHVSMDSVERVVWARRRVDLQDAPSALEPCAPDGSEGASARRKCPTG